MARTTASRGDIPCRMGVGCAATPARQGGDNNRQGEYMKIEANRPRGRGIGARVGFRGCAGTLDRRPRVGMQALPHQSRPVRHLPEVHPRPRRSRHQRRGEEAGPDPRLQDLRQAAARRERLRRAVLHAVSELRARRSTTTRATKTSSTRSPPRTGRPPTRTSSRSSRARGSRCASTSARTTSAR